MISRSRHLFTRVRKVVLGESIAHGVSWNWLGMVVDAGTGFILLPLLVSRLGETGYGFWIVLGAFCGYFQFLDFGLRGSIGRYVAYRRAEGDAVGISEVLGTAVAMLCGVATVAVFASAVLAWFLPSLMTMPGEEFHDARMAGFLVAINLGVMFVMRLFDATLWGFRRFDLLNLIDIPTSLARLALCYLFVEGDHALTMLAGTTIATYSFNSFAKGWFSFRQSSRISISPRLFRRDLAKQLLQFGGLQLVISLCVMIPTSLLPIMIGGFISAAAVTPFAIASRLVGLASQAFVVGVGVVTPKATAIFAQGHERAQQVLYLRSSRIVLFAAISACNGLVLLGGYLIDLWIGPQYPAAGVFTSVLAIGALGAMTSQVPMAILLGTGGHRSLAIGEAVRLMIVLPACLAALSTGSILSACVVLAASQLFFQGLLYSRIAIRTVGIGLGAYCRNMLPILVWSVAASLPLWIAVGVNQPNTWPRFIVDGVCAAFFSIVFAGIAFRSELTALLSGYVGRSTNNGVRISSRVDTSASLTPHA